MVVRPEASLALPGNDIALAASGKKGVLAKPQKILVL